ncbi:MAG: Hpt domain-containing protein, partial [Ignavibacteriales bacterium]|nr:Hpt domain-containing protein [Ignavibacteriales bacterium]
SRLRELEAETDRAFLAEMIDMYIVDSPRHLNELKQGLLANDERKIVAAAHTLKGSSLNLGANALGEACKELEEVVRQRPLTDVQQWVERFDRLFETTCHDLLEHKQRLIG